MPLTSYALDNFVAQELSQLTECRATRIEPDFPNYKSWLDSFVLTRMFRKPLDQNKAALAFDLIRRAEAAISNYEDARIDLATLAEKKSISVYFRCLREFESAVAALDQAWQIGQRVVNKTNREWKRFSPGDRSPYQRLNFIHGQSKHCDPESLTKGHLQTIWLMNEGLFTEGANLTFEELRELIAEIGRLAEKLAKGEVTA